MESNAVPPSVYTYVACGECGAPVNATLAVERRLLDVLYALALSPAWDGAKAPDLEVMITRAVENQDMWVQLLVDQATDIFPKPPTKPIEPTHKKRPSRPRERENASPAGKSSRRSTRSKDGRPKAAPKRREKTSNGQRRHRE